MFRSLSIIGYVYLGDHQHYRISVVAVVLVISNYTSRVGGIFLRSVIHFAHALRLDLAGPAIDYNRDVTSAVMTHSYVSQQFFES